MSQSFHNSRRRSNGMSRKPATWLTNLQQQPNSAKERMAFLAAAGVTGVVGVVWAVALMLQVTHGVQTESPRSNDNESSFIASSKSQLAALFSSFQHDMEALSASSTEDAGGVVGSMDLQAVVNSSQAVSSTTADRPAPLPPPKRERTVLIATSSTETTGAVPNGE